MSECLFCKIVSGEIPSNKVYEDDEALAFEDINAAAPTHLLVIPKRHIATLNDIEESDRALLGHLMNVAKEVAHASDLNNESYRVVMNVGAGAGQTVFHIHFHVLGGRPLSWPPG